MAATRVHNAIPMTTSPDPSSGSNHWPDYPVVLSVSGRPCLVVGGGPVAARRTEGLVSSGARVTVVAPQVVGAIEALATATGVPAVDRAVVSDAVAASVLVTSADGTVPGAVRLPADRRHRTAAASSGAGDDAGAPVGPVVG